MPDANEPKCPLCGGAGTIPIPREPGDRHPPAVRMCKCVLQRQILANVERGMRGLSKAERVPSSRLLGMITQDVWVTGSPEWFTAHLRHVAVRQPPMWGFHVVTDADLMQAWLATKALEGQKIYDVNAAEEFEKEKPSLDYLTLMDISVPPALLVVRLGVKTSANKEMANVLLEAMQMRQHAGKPTWVWDQPTAAGLLRDGHLCYSIFVMEELGRFERVHEHSERPDPGAAGNATRETHTLMSSLYTNPTLPAPREKPAPVSEEVIGTGGRDPDAGSDDEGDLMRQLSGTIRKPKSKYGKGGRK